MRGHAFFYFRDPVATQGVPESIRRSVYAETDSEQIKNLAELKKKIRISGYPVMENYLARWDPEAYDRPSKSNGRLVDLEAFGAQVRDQLWEAIKAEHRLLERPLAETQPDPLAEELDYHNRFMGSRERVYVGREQVNRDLFAFADGDEPVACLVTGPSGSGKSAALAQFVTAYRQQHPKTLVVPHFVGATPRSTDVRAMLQRFCREVYGAILGEQKRTRLAKVQGQEEEIAKQREAIEREYAIPDDVAPLGTAFKEFLMKVPSAKHVLLAVDALNHLDETDRAQHLEWLPPRLPPHVKVVVSCITDSGKPEPALLAFAHRQHHPVRIEPLRDEDRREIIRQVPSLSAKTLDEHQIGLLLSNSATANPLFLLVALEELRGFGAYEQLNDRISALPREGDIVTTLFTQVIERLEEEFDKDVVQSVLTLLASARRGLSDRELLDLVEGASVKIAASTSDLFPILRQLRSYLLTRGGLLDFYHRNLFKAVRERYLNTPETQSAGYARLAKYFHAQEYFLESPEEQRARATRLPPTPRPVNFRKIDELPWQLLEIAKLSGKDDPNSPHWDAVAELFTTLHFLEAQAEAQA